MALETPEELPVTESAPSTPVIETGMEGTEETDETPANYGDGLPPNLLWLGSGPNEIQCEIYLYKDVKTNKLRSVNLEPSETLRQLGFVEYPIHSTWTVPTREQMERYREQASRYNSLARAVLTHRHAMQDLLIRAHLRKLWFSMESNSQNNSLEFTFDRRDRLDDKSFTKLNQMHSTVIDVLFARFVEDAALIV
jgi:hypothetical protein